MATITHQLTLESLECAMCCCIFYVSTEMADARARNKQAIFCPCCGEDAVYSANVELTLEERQAKIKAIHDAEQAEAKAESVAEELAAIKADGGEKTERATRRVKKS